MLRYLPSRLPARWLLPLECLTAQYTHHRWKSQSLPFSALGRSHDPLLCPWISVLHRSSRPTSFLFPSPIRESVHLVISLIRLSSTRTRCPSSHLRLSRSRCRYQNDQNTSNHLGSNSSAILSIQKLQLDRPRKQERVSLHPRQAYLPLRRLRMRTPHFPIDLVLLPSIRVAFPSLTPGVGSPYRLLYNLGDLGLRRLVPQAMDPDRVAHSPIKKTLIDPNRLGRKEKILLIR